MTYLLDTCTLSLLRKKRCRDTDFLRKKIQENIVAYHISALTIGELQFGIMKLQDRQVRTSLQNWLMEDLLPSFENRILPIDETTCMIWGELSANASIKGITIPVSDGLIAATAIQHQMTVITQNTKHFLPTGAKILDMAALSTCSQ